MAPDLDALVAGALTSIPPQHRHIRRRVAEDVRRALRAVEAAARGPERVAPPSEAELHAEEVEP